MIGAVYQYRPGVPLTANFILPIAAVVWDEGSAHRQGTQFYTPSATAATQGVGLLFPGDLYGEALHMWDLKLAKNLRFGRTRLSVGVDVYNLFNADTALQYDPTYRAILLSDGTWVEDNPATSAVEVNPWGTIRGIVDARHAKLSIQFEF